MTQYTHLNQTECNIIANMSASGHRLKAIAEAIGRNKSSISRELQRNRSKRGYRPKRAQTLSELRALNSRNAKRISSDIFNVATQYLNDEWSPEQIAAALPISHTTIYSRVRQALRTHHGNIHPCNRQHTRTAIRRARYRADTMCVALITDTGQIR